jgi:hypothetical protein
MNSIETLDIVYLRSDRTIETVLLISDLDIKKVVYIYNREGLYYKFFFRSY